MNRSVIVALFAGVIALPIACSAQQPATTPGSSMPAQVAPAEKVRCKRYVETGSLAKTRKECHTDAEWQRAAENGRQNARDMVNSALAPGSTPN